jgi:hypothetical protein
MTKARQIKACPVEFAYVAKLRASLCNLTDAILDGYRLLGERHGSAIILADMTGDELVELCDAEMGARYVGR